MRRFTPALGITVISITAVSVVVFQGQLERNLAGRGHRVLAAENSIAGSMPIAVIQPLLAYDPSDLADLTDFFTDIFVVRISENLGSANLDDTRVRTQFSAEIIHTIKGGARGEVILSQAGGYKDGTMYVLSDEGGSGAGSYLASNSIEDYFLNTGKVYLIAARHSTESQWYYVGSSKEARVAIDVGSAISNEDILVRIKEDKYVMNMQEANDSRVLRGAN